MLEFAGAAIGGISVAGGLASFVALVRASSVPLPEAGQERGGVAGFEGEPRLQENESGCAVWKNVVPASVKPYATRFMVQVRKKARTAAQLAFRVAPLDAEGARRVRERLVHAGVALSPSMWRGMHVLLFFLGAVLGVACARVASLHGVMFAACVLCGVAIGAAAPLVWLAHRRAVRVADIEAELPDAMELMGIALAAGSPVEQSFREVARSLEGPLAGEFDAVDREVNLLGTGRSDALRHLASRCASSSVNAFVSQCIQAIEQGSSLAKGLSLQATLMREQAQASALERIRKMPTKLDVALSVCFLPPTVVLVLVPTVVQLLDFLQGSMG